MQTKLGMKMFREAWVSMLWHAMSRTGNWYRKQSQRNTGKGSDRRGDKLGRAGTRLMRQYQARYQ